MYIIQERRIFQMKKIKLILVAFIATFVAVGTFAVSVSADELTPVAEITSVSQPVVDDTTEIIVPSEDGWNVVETPVAELVTPATETPEEPVVETPEVPATPVVDDTPIIEPKTDEPEVPADETPAEPTVPTPVADLVVEPKPEPTPVTPDPEPVKPVQPVDDTPIIEPKKEEPKTPETPKAEEPKVPETPKKEEPKTPETPKESPKEEPKVPKVPSVPETVEVPSVPTTVAEKPQAASAPVATKAAKKRTRLPMTGENSNPTLLLVGLTALMLATGLKVKKVEY